MMCGDGGPVDPSDCVCAHVGGWVGVGVYLFVATVCKRIRTYTRTYVHAYICDVLIICPHLQGRCTYGE